MIYREKSNNQNPAQEWTRYAIQTAFPIRFNNFCHNVNQATLVPLKIMSLGVLSVESSSFFQFALCTALLWLCWTQKRELIICKMLKIHCYVVSVSSPRTQSWFHWSCEFSNPGWQRTFGMIPYDSTQWEFQRWFKWNGIHESKLQTDFSTPLPLFG